MHFDSQPQYVDSQLAELAEETVRPLYRGTMNAAIQNLFPEALAEEYPVSPQTRAFISQ
jgi:hypothetical protein